VLSPLITTARQPAQPDIKLGIARFSNGTVDNSPATWRFLFNRRDPGEARPFWLM
jgi:hypothetical protein